MTLAWSEQDSEATFTQDVELVAVDRVGLFSHLTAIVADANIDIRAVSAHAEDNHLAHLHLTLAIHRREDLQRLMDRLRNLIDVVSVRVLSSAHEHPDAKPLG